MPSSEQAKTPLRILMLHGYTQSGPLYRSKSRALEKALTKSLPSHALTFSYPTAPHKLRPADFFTPGTAPTSTSTTESSLSEPNEPSPPQPPPDKTDDAWGWWTRGGSDNVYIGVEEGFDALARTIRDEGPFDGVIGFSQGAALAVMLASLLETGRKARFSESASDSVFDFPASFTEIVEGHGALKFVVSYAGFVAAPREVYMGFYEPKLQTRALLVRGSLDTVVGEERSDALEGVVADYEVLVHPGGHFVPSGKRELAGACGFVRDALERQEKKGT